MWAVPAAALLFSSSLGLVGSIAQATDIALVASPEEESVTPMRALAQELSSCGLSVALHLPGGLGPRTDELFRRPNKATSTTSINELLNEEAISGGIFAAGAVLPCYGCWEVFGDGKLELYAAGYLNRSAFHSSPITGNAAESSTLPGSLRKQEVSCLFPSPLVHQPLVPFSARAPQSSTEADDDASVEGRRASVSGTHEMATPTPVYGWGAAEVASFISFHAGIPVSTAACALAGLNGRSIIDGAPQGASKTRVSGKNDPLLGQYEGRVLTAAVLAELGVTSSRAQSKVLKALGAASSEAAAAENRGAKEAENLCALLENKFDLGAELSCNDKHHNNHNSEVKDSCGEGGSYQPDHSSCSSSSGGDSSDANSGNNCNYQSKKERLGVFQLLWKVLKAGTNRMMTALMQWLFSSTTESVDFMHTTSDNQVDRVAEYEAWLAYADQFEDVMLEPLLIAWTTKRPSLVVCDRWCYACLDAAELLNLPLVIYNSGLLSQLHDDISTVQSTRSLSDQNTTIPIAKASWRPPAAVVRLVAQFKAMELQIRLKLRLRRYSQVRDARRARLGLGSVAARGSLMSGDGSVSAPHQPLVRHEFSSSSSSERRGRKSGTQMLALSSSPYRALAVISGSVIDVEIPQNLPPSVHLTGPMPLNDGRSSCRNRSSSDDARPRAQLPAKLLHWIEGTDRTQPTLDSSWVAHPITNDNDNTESTRKNNGDNGTSSSWAVRPAPVVVVDLGPHWASNAHLSRAAWAQAGREALALLQGVGIVNSTGHALAKRPPGPPTDLRIASSVSNNANADLVIRVVWLLPEDQWGLLPKAVLQTANAPGGSLMLVSPLEAEGVRASNGKLDTLLAHGNVAALVACGGVERTHRALLHRKPLLLLPRSSVDHELALKLSALRVAVTIDMNFVNEATPEASRPVHSDWSNILNEGLWRLLLDPKVPRALASVAKLVQGGGGVQRAVNLIEQALVLSTNAEDDANFDEFSTVNECVSGSSHMGTKKEAKEGSIPRPHSNDLNAECAVAGLSENRANHKFHQRTDPSASSSEALSAADSNNSITRREGRASELIRLLSASVRNSNDFGSYPWDVLAAHAIAAMVVLLSGKFLLKVFLQMLKRATQLLVRKLVTRPMGLRAKSSANNFDISNGRPQVPNDDVSDPCEGGEDDEEGWPELLLALAAVPLALVGWGCRVFGRFAVSWVGVPLLDLLLGPADVSLDARAPQSFSSIGGASYQAASSHEELNHQNELAGNASIGSRSSGDASGVSSSGSRCGRRKRERAAMAQPPYGFPSVEGEVSSGLVLPPQPAGITRLIFGPGVSFGIYIMQSPGRGLYVSHVEPGYGLGVTTGDLLVEINGEAVALGALEVVVTTRLQSLSRPVVLGFSRRGLDFMSALKEDYPRIPGT